MENVNSEKEFDDKSNGGALRISNTGSKITDAHLFTMIKTNHQS